MDNKMAEPPLGAREFDRKYNILDISTPRHTYMAGRFKRSFAYFTLRNRLPVILTNIIDSMAKDKEELVAKYGELSREEIKTVIGQISELKYQLETDKPLLEFSGDAEDYELWNTFIQTLPTGAQSFYKACWLYTECYIYRKVYSFFDSTQTLRTHDYFAKQKENALLVSIDSAEVVFSSELTQERSEQNIKYMLKLNLWGNQCDMSISLGKELRPSTNPLTQLSSMDKYILVDSSKHVWNCLSTADRSKPVIVDFVLDNSGYELVTDLTFADYLIDKKLADKVRFHLKALPWFISDVTEHDFTYSLKFLSEHKSPALSAKGHHWTRLVEEGKFDLQPREFFWTSAYEYYRMRDVHPTLYFKLSEARLLILKGDLNYRKLLGDFSWDSTENFTECIRGFLPTNIVALRTVKADLICGLPAGVAEKLHHKNSNWMTTGKYGVIQFAEHMACGCEPPVGRICSSLLFF